MVSTTQPSRSILLLLEEESDISDTTAMIEQICTNYFRQEVSSALSISGSVPHRAPDRQFHITQAYEKYDPNARTIGPTLMCIFERTGPELFQIPLEPTQIRIIK